MTASQQAPEQRFVEGVRLLRVHARQRGPTDESDAQVVELAGLRAEVADDVAQALPAGQLPESQGDELRPTGDDAQALAVLMVSGFSLEFVSRKQFEELPEDCAMMGRGLDLRRLERFVDTSHSTKHRGFKPFSPQSVGQQ